MTDMSKASEDQAPSWSSPTSTGGARKFTREEKNQLQRELQAMSLDEDRSTSWESTRKVPSQDQLPFSRLEEIDRCARAYGYEIGRGQALGREIVASQDNPFLDPHWRDRIVDSLPKE